MSQPSPKVFICHASEDKERFVLPFAKALLNKGVDAWVDKFEILAGDSIVRKIFDQGIENASAVIAVISPASVVKPWVQAEIDVAFVRRIEGKCKLIPVVLEGTQVPTALSALRWETVSDLSNFEAALHNVLLSVFNQYEKPPIGEAPNFVTQDVASIPNLSRIDAAILVACCEASIKEDKLLLEAPTLIQISKDVGISDDSLCESLEVLHSKGLIDLEKIDSGDVTGCTPLISGFDTFLRATDRNYAAHFLQIIARIVNNQDVSGEPLMEATGLPARTVYHFVKYLSLNGHFAFHDWSHYGCKNFKISAVNPTLRRILEQSN